MTGVGRVPGLTMAAENIGHLELRPEHVGLASDRSRRLNVGELECALNLADHVDGSPSDGRRSRTDPAARVHGRPDIRRPSQTSGFACRRYSSNA